jgi:hypothetical protein
VPIETRFAVTATAVTATTQRMQEISNNQILARSSSFPVGTLEKPRHSSESWNPATSCC